MVLAAEEGGKHAVLGQHLANVFLKETCIPNLCSTSVCEQAVPVQNAVLLLL